MLGDADAVAIGDFGDGDLVLVGGFEIGVVGADARCHDELQVFGFGDPLRRHIGGPEGLRDHHVRVVQLLVERRVRALLVRGDNELMAIVLGPFLEAEGAADAAQKLARLEINRRGGSASSGRRDRI